MRSHEDFVRELALVLELDGTIIGNIMYTKAKLVDEAGETKQVLTFGPVSILPEWHCHLRKSEQLCKPWVPKLQAVQYLP